KPSRVSTIAGRLQHDGQIAFADSRRVPPDIGLDEAATLLIAVLADHGLGSVAESARGYAAMTSAEGYRLAETVLAILRGEAIPGDLIVKQGGVTATINGQHVVFGAPAEDGPARFATGDTLAAITAELQGTPPHH